jgi:hypothetical protein
MIWRNPGFSYEVDKPNKSPAAFGTQGGRAVGINVMG